jgi:single-stranded-DNA-specific exonuclease
MAAGLSLEEPNLDEFSAAFDAEVEALLDPSIPSNRVETDGELANDEIALETAQALREGGPWGQAFPEPCFDGLFAIKNARVVGDKHLKMWVTTSDRSRAFDAIAFNFKGADDDQELPCGDVRLVYRLDINEYKGERRLQLLVDHVLK